MIVIPTLFLLCSLVAAHGKSLHDQDTFLTASFLNQTHAFIEEVGHNGPPLNLDHIMNRSLRTFSPSNSIAPDRSSEFQIQSTEQIVGTNGNLCFQVRSLSAGSSVIVRPCNSGSTYQKWAIDEYGRLHTRDDDNLCITKKKALIKLQDCASQGLFSNMFVINGFDNTVNFRGYGNKVLSVKGDNPIKGRLIHLPMQNANKKMQKWIINPSTLFPSKEDFPSEFYIKSKGNSLCIEASSLDGGSALNLRTCEPNKNTQKWTVNAYGVIKNSESPAVCIMNDENNLTMKTKCKRKQSTMFMFDVVDSSIVLKRNGGLAFSISGDLLLLSDKIPLEIMQQWSLETTLTTNELRHVGNPCTDVFGEGSCEICTGDCDGDYECAGDMRCAQRAVGVSEENVPGCVWGPDSDNLRRRAGDYCE